MMPLVLITCGSKKRSTPCAAADLYTGIYFGKMVRFARTIAPDSRIYIVSAKHGLLRMNQIIAPYNLRMGKPGSITADIIKRQAEALGLRPDERVIFVGGSDYLPVLAPTFTNIERPLVGKGTIGKQTHYMRLASQSCSNPAPPPSPVSAAKR